MPKSLVDRNSIGLLFSHGRKSLDRIIALRTITLIGAGLTWTFSFGQHIPWLDYTPIGLSTVVKSFRFNNDCGCMWVYIMCVCSVSSDEFLYPCLSEILRRTPQFSKCYWLPLWNLGMHPLVFEIFIVPLFSFFDYFSLYLLVSFFIFFLSIYIFSSSSLSFSLSLSSSDFFLFCRLLTPSLSIIHLSLSAI